MIGAKINLKLDKQNMLGSITAIPKQIESVFNEAKTFNLPKSYGNIKNIVINGMGGSALAGHIIQSLYLNKIKTPVQITNSYNIPAYVSSSTLYIASSYSGNTEEIVNALSIAVKRKAQVVGIAAGGKLALLCKQYNCPLFSFNTKYNYCGQPRIGVGYSFAAHIEILNKIGILKLTASDKKLLVKTAKKNASLKTKGRSFAKNFKRKIPFIIASEFLAGNAHLLSNQINENAKHFSDYLLMPEINHHLLEGLKFPFRLSRSVIFLLINSPLYSQKIQKRFDVTKKILLKEKIKFIEYNMREKTKVGQSMEMLMLGSYISFYLGMLNKINPSPIPVVDYFKKEMQN